MTEIIVTKWNWDRVKDGVLTRLELYTEKQLRNLYGDEYERMSVRLRVEETESQMNPEKGAEDEIPTYYRDP